MSKMYLSGIEFDVIYVDPSTASPGDGSSPASALGDLPVFASLQNKAAYVIRRLGGLHELNFPAGSSSADGLTYAFVVMPKSTDLIYELMPSEARTAWGSDSSSIDYAWLKVASSGMSLTGSNVLITAHRAYFYGDGQSQASPMLNITKDDYTCVLNFDNCRFGCSGYELDQSTAVLTASTSSLTRSILYNVTGAGTAVCNGKYYLLSGTHGSTSAVYQNMSSSCKIYYNSDQGYWCMYDSIASYSYYYYAYGGGNYPPQESYNWSTSMGSSPSPTVSPSTETIEMKVKITGGSFAVNGDYWVSSGTHGGQDAVYTNGPSEIYHDSSEVVWAIRSSGGSTALFLGTSELYGNYEGENSWTNVPSYGMSNYINCGRPYSFGMSGCVINVFARAGMYDQVSYVVRMTNKKICSLSDVSINVICDSSSCMSAMLSFCNSSGTSESTSNDAGSYLKLYNVSFKIFKKATSANATNTIPCCIFDNYSSFVEMRKISVTMPVDAKIGSSNVTTITQGFYSTDSYNPSLANFAVVAILNPNEFDIDGVTMSFPQFWKVLKTSGSSGSPALFAVCGGLDGDGYMYSYNSITPGSMHNIKNISITCAQGSGEGTHDGFDSSQPTGNYYSEIASNNFSDPSCALRLYRYTTETWEVSSISVIHPHGVAAEISACWLESEAMQGTIRANSSAVVDVTSLSTWYAGKAIAPYNNSTIRIGSLNCGTGGSATPDSEYACLHEPYSKNSFVYVGSSNRQMLTDTRSTGASYSNKYGVICASEKHSGRYTMRTENYLVMTYGTFRTTPLAPVNATLRIQNSWCSSAQTSLTLGQPPFGGFQKIPSKTGKQILNVHAAVLGFGNWSAIKDLISKNVIVEALVPALDGRKSVLSFSGSWMLDTSSVWSDSNISASDPDGTGFPLVMKMPLSIYSLNPVDIKIHYRWYSTGGSFFLDPFFTFTDP